MLNVLHKFAQLIASNEHGTLYVAPANPNSMAVARVALYGTAPGSTNPVHVATLTDVHGGYPTLTHASGSTLAHCRLILDRVASPETLREIMLPYLAATALS